MAFSFKMPQLPACCRPGYIGMTPSGGQRGSAPTVGGKNCGREAGCGTCRVFSLKSAFRNAARGKVKLRPIFGRLPCGKRRAKSLDVRPHTCLRSRYAIRFRMQNISWNPVRRCGGIVVRGYARETDFFHGCLRAAFVSIANLRKTFDACKFFFMFFAWLSRRRIFTAGRVSVRRRHAIYRADGGLEKNSKSRA